VVMLYASTESIHQACNDSMRNMHTDSFGAVNNKDEYSSNQATEYKD